MVFDKVKFDSAGNLVLVISFSITVNRIIPMF